MSDAISNILSTCIYRTPGRVGFARGGETFTQNYKYRQYIAAIRAEVGLRWRVSCDNRLGQSTQVCRAVLGIDWSLIDLAVY